MRKFQNRWIYLLFLIMILTGCGQRSLVINTVGQLQDEPQVTATSNDQPSSTAPFPDESRVSAPSVETIPVKKDGIIGNVPAGRSIQDLWEFDDDAPYQNVFRLDEVSDYIVVTLSNQDNMIFTLPNEQYISGFIEIRLADLDQDGSEEIITYCVQAKTGDGILHILNIATGMLLDTPIMDVLMGNDNTAHWYESVGGVDYHVLSDDSHHFRLLSDSPLYETICDISNASIYDRIYTSEYTLSKEDYFLSYDKPAGTKVGSVSGISGSSTDGFAIVIRNSRPCVTIRQQVYGLLGNGDWLGKIDTFLSWDTNGTLTIEEIVFQQREVAVSDSWDFNSTAPYRKIIVENYKDENNLHWWSQLVVTTKEQREVSFVIPGGLKVLSFDRIVTSDFNGDGALDIAVSYSPIAYTGGVCVLDVQNGYMSFPTVNEPEDSMNPLDGFPPGLPYQMVSGGNDTLLLTCEKMNVTVKIPLTLEELAASQDLSIMGSAENHSAKNYLYPYRQPKGTTIEGASVSGIEFQSLAAVTLDGRPCLQFRQSIVGVWGRGDHLGYVDSVIAWDSQGEYEVIQANYVPVQPVS